MKKVSLATLSCFAFSVVFFLHTSFAQTYDGYGEDSGLLPTDPSTVLPSATGGSGTAYERNIFLHEGDDTNPKTESAKSPAQIANGNLSGVYNKTRLSCPYSFERDIYTGIVGEDVRLLQVILNSDPRTVIAESGPGSPGNETTTFGAATKDAVFRFQTLFKGEWLPVANGRFGPRTRTIMNAICNGTESGNTVSNGNVYENLQSVQKDATPKGEVTVIPNDKISPRVTLAANLNTVKVGDAFKIVASISEEVKSFTPEAIIVDGGEVKEIRKLSKTSYTIGIIPGETAKSVSIQIEAERLSDLAGNTNEDASNEINVKVVASAALADATSSEVNIDSLLGKISQSAAQGNAVYDQTANCYQGTGPLPNGVPETARCSNKPATYDSSRNCYSDTGALPTGISETARCNNPQNPNNPNNPNSTCNPAYQQQLIAQQQQMSAYYGYTVPIQNPCTNPAAVASAQQNAQQAQQQAMQNGMLGSLLGSLLKGFGGLGNSSSKDSPSSRDSSPSAPSQTTPAASETAEQRAAREKAEKEAAAKAETEKKMQEDAKKATESTDGKSGVVKEKLSCLFLADSDNNKIDEWTSSTHTFFKMTTLSGNGNFLLIYLIKFYNENLKDTSTETGGGTASKNTTPTAGMKFITDGNMDTGKKDLKCCTKADATGRKCATSTEIPGKAFIATKKIDFAKEISASDIITNSTPEAKIPGQPPAELQQTKPKCSGAGWFSSVGCVK